VRLEQIYSPSIAFERTLTAHVLLRARPAPPVPGSSTPPQPGDVVKDLGTFDGVARDLRESPFPFELDVHDVADGGYQLSVEVSNDSAPLGASTLNIALRRGLDDLAARLEADGRNAPEALRAEILVAAPLGYRVDGSYGWGLGNPPADPVTRRVQDFSEQDVMQVLQHVRQQYKIDGNRIYLMGHSMGAIGTWKIAPKYPDVWAAIAPISGSGA